MIYKTHSNGGLFLGYIISFLFVDYIWSNFDFYNILILFSTYTIFLILGSLLPDIDHPSSKLGKIIPRVSSTILKKFGHRTITHSLITIFFTAIILGIVNNILRLLFTYFYYEYQIFIFAIELGIIIGWLSHILLDMLNPSGVYLFYPYPKKFKFLKERSVSLMSKEEYKISGRLGFLSILFLVYYNYKFIVISFRDYINTLF